LLLYFGSFGHFSTPPQTLKITIFTFLKGTLKIFCPSTLIFSIELAQHSHPKRQELKKKHHFSKNYSGL